VTFLIVHCRTRRLTVAGPFLLQLSSELFLSPFYSRPLSLSVYIKVFFSGLPLDVAPEVRCRILFGGGGATLTYFGLVFECTEHSAIGSNHGGVVEHILYE
jgi:hypothetical protein